MVIKLHSQATTPPKIRAAIQASDDPAWVLAERHGTTEQTVWKWCQRASVEDRSHTPHRLQTTLTPAQEAVAVALRKTLLVSLDDLLAVVREFLNPNASRSGLDRCLRRHGVGPLRALKAASPRPKHSAFKAYEPGSIPIDLKYLPPMAERAAAVPSSWPSTGQRVGLLSGSTTARQRPMPGASCAPWSAPARCGSAPYSRIMEKSSRIASSVCASAPQQARMNATRWAPPSTSIIA